MKKDQGFTLIELLVVIAIIGILASVVLASLNVARNKGANTAVKSNLDNMRSQAELVYDANSGSYAPVCGNNQISKAVTAAAVAGLGTGATVDITYATAQTSTTANCHSSSTGWAASVPLKAPEGSSIYWCVDNSGTSAGRINPLAASTEVCPAS